MTGADCALPKHQCIRVFIDARVKILILVTAHCVTGTRFAMYKNSKKHRFVLCNSGFLCKYRTKTPHGITCEQ